MTITFPREINDVIDTGVEILREITKDNNKFKKCLEAGKTYTANMKNNFRDYRLVWIEDTEIISFIDDVIISNNRREESLNKMELSLKDNNREILNEAIIEFQDLSVKIQSLLINLMGKIEKITNLSPFPSVDNFVRLARNIESGYVNMEMAAEKLSNLTELIEFIKKDTDLFTYIYEEERAIPEQLKTCIRTFEEEIKNLNNILNVTKDRENLTKALETLLQSSKELFENKEKMDNFSKEKAKSSMPLMEKMINKGDSLIKDSGQFIEFENIFHSFTYPFLLSISELYNFDNNNPVRSNVAKKYYPFIEERGRIIRDKLEQIRNIIKVSMDKELISSEMI